MKSVFACAGMSAAFVADCLGTVGIAERFVDSRWFLPFLFAWWIVAGSVILTFTLAVRREVQS
jgi:hypothetical protein